MTADPNRLNIAPSNDWAAIDEMEKALLREMTAQQSLLHYLELQASMEWQLQKTAGFFEDHRRQALIELQSRLSSLVER
jgi:hypothetical protein